MRRGWRRSTISTISVVVATALFGSLAAADEPPPTYPSDPQAVAACSPGFWKNHPDAWAQAGIASTDPTGNVFNQALLYDLHEVEFVHALDGGGGPGAEGAARILLRAGVAALLNSAVPNASYPLTSDEVNANVNGALATMDRDFMLEWAEYLDRLNNSGGCTRTGPGGQPTVQVTLPPSR